MAHLPKCSVVVFVFLVVGVHVPASHASALLLTYDGSMCSESSNKCGGIEIKYPFYFANETRVTTDDRATYSCGYTDLKIFCQDYGGAFETAFIQLGQYNYTVKDIHYEEKKTILLSDADAFRRGNDACPVVQHNVSFGPDWLRYEDSSHDNLAFFLGCYSDDGDPMPEEFNAYQIVCPKFSKPLGTGATLVFSSEQQAQERDVAEHCRDVFVAPVLRDSLYGPIKPRLPTDYGNVLRQGFQLEWYPMTTDRQCPPCEQTGGRCAYSQHKTFLGCLCPGEKVSATNCSSSDASSTPARGSRKGKKIPIAPIAGGVAGGFLFLVAAGAAFFVIRKRNQKEGVNSSSKLLKYSGSGGTPYSRGGDTESGSIVQDPQTHLFSYEELEEATDRFNDNRELGDGGFGTVYKGYLKDGRVVAVKRLYNNSYRRVEQFVNEAAILSRLRHPNLVMFYGCTSSTSRELLLVYEFVANGTVADHLHGHRAPERALSWPLRLNIAVESAAALTYLHAIEPPIVHRDVKTTNILLDADFHVKVADFGLSRLFPLDATHVSTAPQGTPGYVDPEYHQCYQLTDKSDVYSFGVVLVELISSKPAVDITRHRNEINLAGMAINKIQKCQLEQLVDLELGYESDPATKKMMTMVAELAFRCLQQNGEMRPPIKEVFEVLRAIQGECRVEKDGDKNKDLAGSGPFSPNTVHAPWDSRATTPNTSRD